MPRWVFECFGKDQSRHGPELQRDAVHAPGTASMEHGHLCTSGLRGRLSLEGMDRFYGPTLMPDSPYSRGKLIFCLKASRSNVELVQMPCSSCGVLESSRNAPALSLPVRPFRTDVLADTVVVRGQKMCPPNQSVFSPSIYSSL